MSFFKKVEARLKSLFSKLPSWDTTALATLKFAAPLLETVAALVEPQFAPAVDAIVAKLQNGFAVAAVTIDDAGPNANLTSVMGSINTNLSQLEGAAQIKDPATAAKLTAIVNTISGELAAIGSASVAVAA